MAVVYDKLDNYNKYENLFGRFKDVTVSKTKYSIKIDYGKKKVFLNKDGKSGHSGILTLINKVKKDAQNYLDTVGFDTTKSNDIFWSFFNDESGMLGQGLEFEVAKIDLTSAYWTKATNDKVLSKETIGYFNGLEFDNVKEKKGARLRALGSLATVKSTIVYNYGKRSRDVIPNIFNEDFRSLYMGICNGVAQDMQTVLGHVDGIYYYWDCIFVDPSKIKEVERLFKDLGYNCTVEKHTAKVFKSKHNSYFCCPNMKGELIEYPLY